jgi:putative FmdB family regulatory protein
MPIYEYACRRCDRPFETLVRRFGDPVSCPHCTSSEVDRQLSVFAVGNVSAPAFPGCREAACDPACGNGPCGGGGCGLPR